MVVQKKHGLYFFGCNIYILQPKKQKWSEVISIFREAV